MSNLKVIASTKQSVNDWLADVLAERRRIGAGGDSAVLIIVGNDPHAKGEYIETHASGDLMRDTAILSVIEAGKFALMEGAQR